MDTPGRCRVPLGRLPYHGHHVPDSKVHQDHAKMQENGLRHAADSTTGSWATGRHTGNWASNHDGQLGNWASGNDGQLGDGQLGDEQLGDEQLGVAPRRASRRGARVRRL